MEAGPPSGRSTGPAGLALGPRRLSGLEEAGKMSSLRQRAQVLMAPGRLERTSRNRTVLKGESGLLPP